MAGTFQADSYTDSAGTGAPTFPFGMTLSAGQVLKVDTISNAAGTGAPNFNHGLTLTTAQVLQADTIANAAGTGAPTFSQGLIVATSKVLQSDSIANTAGTGAPTFTQGIIVTATKTLRVDTILDSAGVAAPTFSQGIIVTATKTLRVDTINDSAGTGAPNFSIGATGTTLNFTGVSAIGTAAITGALPGVTIGSFAGVSGTDINLNIRRNASGGNASILNFLGDNTNAPWARLRNANERALDFLVQGSTERRFLRFDHTTTTPIITLGDATTAGNYVINFNADSSGGFARTINFQQNGSTNCSIANPNDTSMTFTTNGTIALGLNPTQTIAANITNWASSGTQDVGFSVTTGAGVFQKFTSSRRYKHDIANVSFDTQKIYDLTAKEFSWNSNNERDFGYIAEEVAAILPEIVIYATKEVERERDEEGQLIGEVEYEKVLDDHGDTMVEAVKYRQLTVLIIEEMKKLRSRIAILEQA